MISLLGESAVTGQVGRISGEILPSFSRTPRLVTSEPWTVAGLFLPILSPRTMAPHVTFLVLFIIHL